MPVATEQPKYRRLAEMLRSQIENGELNVGDRLPSLVQMHRDHGATKATMQRVYELLEKDNLIERRGGSGVYVAQPPQRQLLGKLGLMFHVLSLSGAYWEDLLVGVQGEAARQGLEIVLLDEAMEKSKVDAVLLYCHVSEALALNLPETLPQVLLFQHSPDFTCVAADDFEGAKIATRFLLGKGHRRIAYLITNTQESIARLRLAGYQTAHEEAGIPLEGNQVKIFDTVRSQNFMEAGEIAMADWLKSNWQETGCTAIMTQNDGTAIGVIKALSAAGLRVPQDVSVVGFDGTKDTDFCIPPLTTIKVPMEEIGARAVKVLSRQIREGVSAPEKIILPVQLKMGESVTPRMVMAKI